MKPTAAAIPETEARDRGLDRLADEIRARHKAVERHARKMVAEAVAAGEALLDAKGRLRHGEFGPFLAYCGVSDRSARVYMRLARNSGSAAVLGADSIRAALDALAPPPRPEDPWRLTFGRPGANRAHGGWQLARWREAMADARGVPVDEVPPPNGAPDRRGPRAS